MTIESIENAIVTRIFFLRLPGDISELMHSVASEPGSPSSAYWRTILPKEAPRR
jgi:hypothetical protein